MLKQEVINFLRDNLIIETEFENKYAAGNNMIVSLRFAGDKTPFSKAYIYIPDDEDNS